MIQVNDRAVNPRGKVGMVTIRLELRSGAQVYHLPDGATIGEWHAATDMRQLTKSLVNEALERVEYELKKHPGDAPWGCITCHNGRPCYEKLMWEAARAGLKRNYK